MLFPRGYLNTRVYGDRGGVVVGVEVKIRVRSGTAESRIRTEASDSLPKFVLLYDPPPYLRIP